MNKFFAILLSFMPLGVLAQTLALPNPVEANSLPEVVTIALAKVLPIFITLTVLVFIYFGFLFVKSQGNPEAISKAKTGMRWAIVGAALLIGANALADAFIRKLAEL